MNDKVEEDYGFHSLLNAAWLQMSWLLRPTAQERRCKWCGRVIVIEPGEMQEDPGLAKNVRGRYKMRKDKAFCNDPQDKSKSRGRANYRYHHVTKPFKQLEKLHDPPSQ